MTKKALKLVFFLLLIYYCVGVILLNRFLFDLLFLKVQITKTHENNSFKVHLNKDELLVRIYGDSTKSDCVIFFPGRHGGIDRYESEIFGDINKAGIPVYVLSYPGYEGAKGDSTFESVSQTTTLAIQRIERDTSCHISESVFIGRSLGAIIALMSASKWKPKGMLLDSMSPSLSESIRENLKKHFLTMPLTILPIALIIKQDVVAKNFLERLHNVPIVVFQGQLDETTPIDAIRPLLRSYSNIEIIEVENAKHSDVHIWAKDRYLYSLLKLLRRRSATDDK